MQIQSRWNRKWWRNCISFSFLSCLYTCTNRLAHKAFTKEYSNHSYMTDKTDFSKLYKRHKGNQKGSFHFLFLQILIIWSSFWKSWSMFTRLNRWRHCFQLPFYSSTSLDPLVVHSNDGYEPWVSSIPSNPSLELVLHKFFISVISTLV